MTDPKQEQEDNPVPLALAGIAKQDIDRQLDKLLHSEAFEGKAATKRLLSHLVQNSVSGNTQRLRGAEIAKAVFPKSDDGPTRVRKEAGMLRKCFEAYYSSPEAKAGEVRFTLPERQYVVHARAQQKPQAEQKPALGSILEPAVETEVYQSLSVAGRIDGLDPDLRVWLVVRTPVGDHYPQCRVSRKSPDWKAEVRIGRLQPGSDEGAVYEILLVATDADGDAEFYQYIRENRDGFGSMLPTDSEILDQRKVTRRDNRPQSGA